MSRPGFPNGIAGSSAEVPGSCGPTSAGPNSCAELARIAIASSDPSPKPTVVVTRLVADNAAVAFRGNSYSVPPGLRGGEVELRHRLGAATVEVHGPSGAMLVSRD